MIKGKYPKIIKLLTAWKHYPVPCTPQESWNPNKPARGQRRPLQNRRTATGHLQHNSVRKETEGNHTRCAIHLQIQQKGQTRGLEGYGSSCSAPQTIQLLIPM
ncbi:hypothetical protein O181_063745 [Austropuccinia psidii MF-1]|uniref:Uncharacterized protein n=1 Tax=Austropuccinia psidii MF-1 TaxID=1389203 RepID=A0A9Q3ERV5_9BASI|nr:hypothetical protein [Austropuccinia psidii MF-1]